MTPKINYIALIRTHETPYQRYYQGCYHLVTSNQVN